MATNNSVNVSIRILQASRAHCLQLSYIVRLAVIKKKQDHVSYIKEDFVTLKTGQTLSIPGAKYLRLTYHDTRNVSNSSMDYVHKVQEVIAKYLAFLTGFTPASNGLSL